jgi:hypothetical protein
MIIDKQNWQQLIQQSILPFWHTHDRGPYFHKLDALMATDDIGTIKYDCFHDSLDCVDWSREPEDSYESLCASRAQQIRDCNDWVRLWYSGGADSHTALMSFLSAGCFPDEVITMRWSDVGSAINVETDHLVLPSINQLQALFPKTKFKVVDYRHDWFERNATDDWQRYFFKHEHNCPWARNVCVSHDVDNSLLDVYDTHGRVANVTGEPKPNILKRHGRWWAVLIDNQLAGMHGIPGLEMFHLSPAMPELYIKQCHMLKRDFASRSDHLSDAEIWALNQDLANKNRALQRHNRLDVQCISRLQWHHGKTCNINGDHGFNVMFDRDIDRRHVRYYHHLRSLLHQELWSRKPAIFHTGHVVKNSIGIFSHFWCLDHHAVATVDQLFPDGFDL